jgi:hypothetical protein
MGKKFAGTWLTENIVEASRKRAKPWVDEGHKVVYHFEGLPQMQHQRHIQRTLNEAPEGTFLVAALPPASKVVHRFDASGRLLLDVRSVPCP